jgi:hydrogenase expression/formation protein HypE
LRVGAVGKAKMRIKPGKLSPEFLEALIERYGGRDPQVILGPGIGRDAAVISLGDVFLVAKSDPVTFASQEIGWYAVHINANDLACLGAAPRWFLATLLLPERKTEKRLVEAVFSQIHEACSELGAVLCGGHTEITLGLDRPVVAGTMLGQVGLSGLVRPDGARPGNGLLLTKGVAIEGTSVLAREHEGLKARLDQEELERCAELLHRPGISVVKEAMAACRAGGVCAMHDPTEGGIATALREMAHAAGVGLLVRKEAIAVRRETRKVCEVLGLDPMGLLASGALLLAVESSRADGVRRAILAEGVEVFDIGEVTEKTAGILWVEKGQTMPIPRFDRDEVARALETT